MKGIDRQHGPGSTRSRLPITVSILRRLVDTVLGSSKHLVDKYMLQAAMLLAFHGCLRCAEFLAPADFNPLRHATRDDIKIDPKGLEFTLRTSKTDPYGKGTLIHIGYCEKPLCAPTALSTYLRFSTGNAGDPLFRFRDGRHLTKSVFVEEVRHLLQAAAVPNVKEYQGHSFRIGAATSAAVAGVPEWQIRALGRWRSDAVLRYIRANPAGMRKVASQVVNPNTLTQ